MKSITQISCSFVSNFITIDIECGERLWEKVKMHPYEWRKNDIYCVITQRMAKKLYSFSIDFIITNAECGECLFDKLMMYLRDIKEKYTHCIITQSITQMSRTI